MGEIGGDHYEDRYDFLVDALSKSTEFIELNGNGTTITIKHDPDYETRKKNNGKNN